MGRAWMVVNRSSSRQRIRVALDGKEVQLIGPCGQLPSVALPGLQVGSARASAARHQGPRTAHSKAPCARFPEPTRACSRPLESRMSSGGMAPARWCPRDGAGNDVVDADRGWRKETLTGTMGDAEAIHPLG